MRIKSVEYSEFEGTEQEWTLKGLLLSTRNLIVGKNASGKTRVLNIINSLASYLAGRRSPGLSANYNITFDNGGKTLRYKLKFEQEQVVMEEFEVEGKVLLERGTDGEGHIWAEDIDGEKKKIRFQTPPGQLAAVARRDSIQHAFLEPLHAWASTLHLYYFGTSLGKDHLAVHIDKGVARVDGRDTNKVVAIFRQAEKEFGEKFKQAIMSDMRKLEYDIEEVGVKPPVSILVPGLPGELMGLYVKERGLSGITDQHSMSQGMFRAFSIFVQVNYSHMSGDVTGILVDDIGEGLDFERSGRLIELLREKADEFNVQLVLSTNDRFVMNHVPLEEWSVLQREGGHVRVRNYENSRDVFEDFKFTGLSNFSFLEMDFVSGPLREEAAIHE